MKQRKSVSASRRNGSVLVAALICLLVTSIVVGSLLRANHITSSQLGNQLRDVQTHWLAEAAIARAVAHLEADENYSGETWTVTADELGHHFGGQAEINLRRLSDEQFQIAVKARCPASGPNFSGSTHTITLTKDEQ